MKHRLILPLALAALYGCADNAPTEPMPRVPSTRPLLGAFPGTNGRLAFVNDGLLQTMNTDGSDVQTLDPFGVAPAWSPDGSKIAFNSSSTGNNNIYVINADGTGKTQLTFYTGDIGVSSPTWSPDGSKIAFQNDSEGAIYVMNSNGTGITRLTNSLDFGPSWSPDGSKIAFTTVRHSSRTEIYVMNADGTGQTRLTNNLDADFDPSWSPDGSKIVFMHDDAAASGDWPDIYTMNPDGTGVTNLTNTPVFAEVSAVWSPDGTKIAFIGSDDFNSDVYIMNANGSGRANITNSTGVNEFHLDWQGNFVAPVCPFPQKVYMRLQGAPQRFVETFAATPGSYTVDLDDLATSGADATVTLNGVVIMEGRGTTGEVGPRHKVVTVTLLANNTIDINLRGKKGSKLQVKICPASGSQCYPNLPAPQLTLESATDDGSFVRFEFDVPNYAQFPAALFTAAPNLPACGLNTSSSRTWVTVFDGNGVQLFGFCSFSSPSDLNLVWAATPVDQRPAEAYITLTDRQCNTTYTSNRVSLAP